VWFVSGCEEASLAGGHAELSIPISGPRGKGTIDLEVAREGGHWSYKTLVVIVRNRQISLIPATVADPSPPA